MQRVGKKILYWLTSNCRTEEMWIETISQKSREFSDISKRASIKIMPIIDNIHKTVFALYLNSYLSLV